MLRGYTLQEMVVEQTVCFVAPSLQSSAFVLLCGNRNTFTPYINTVKNIGTMCKFYTYIHACSS